MNVGFDFGTTNSLISVVVGNRVVNIVDDEGLPVPSVVRYEGEKVTVGKDAKEQLDSAGLGVHGNTIRSPKFLLAEDAVYVGGVERDPRDIVGDVVRFAKEEALQSPHAKHLGGVKQAVVTIPVTMNGSRRAKLRDSFRSADIGIVQYVHEPLAALYGYVRSLDDPKSFALGLQNRNVLVVDWGGGTLDLTLCRIEANKVSQIRNGGSEEIGGDRFDHAIRDEVIKRAMESAGIETQASISPEAKLRLLHASEVNKIELSDRDSVTFYRPGFFESEDLNYRLTRSELDEITRPLVDAGIAEIKSLLESVNLGPGQISLCLVAGGMASMPSIRGRINEIFGPQRVIVPQNSGTLISEGAAWIAHDGEMLHLAKPVELQLARGSFLTLIKSGAPMPRGRKISKNRVKVYCTDPSDGIAKVQLCTPTRLSKTPSNSEPRSSLGNLTVNVDARAGLFQECIDIESVIDEDLILTVTAKSSDVKDSDRSTFFDLEFGIDLPVSLFGSVSDPKPEIDDDYVKTPGELLLRANISLEKEQALVPGEVLYRKNPGAFNRDNYRNDRATEQQVREYLYYQPCAVCGRDSSDLECRCDVAG